MNNAEAVNWLINITADIGKVEHQNLWHYEQALSEIREMLEDAPSVQPQRWIPVTGRLPEDDEEVIVTCLDDSGDTPFRYTTVAWHYKGMWVCDNERCPFVTAWMPLPEPWRGQNETN